jgi:uncharacterized protein (TIGR03437 family)
MLPLVYRALTKLSCRRRVCAVILLAAAAAIASPAQTFTTLVNFNVTDGAYPQHAWLTQGKDGNLYGTTGYGSTGFGTTPGSVFKMTTGGTLTTLHFFSGADGLDPRGVLTQGTDGNFYGITLGGGSDVVDCVNGCGTIFKITPGGALTTLHSFRGTDGACPSAGLVQASDGSFYGTTTAGGIGFAGAADMVGCSGLGTIFKITADGTLTTIYSFGGHADGSKPSAGLLQATDGNFYGNASGTLFKITPGGTLTTLSFASGGTEGALIQAADGNFYGTGSSGGTYGFGAVFKMSPAGPLTTLYSFGAAGCFKPECAPNGALPMAGVVQASDGNFYGTTSAGGTAGDCIGIGGCGTVFQITPGGTFTTVHFFSGPDGHSPSAGLLAAADGNLYGEVPFGGAHNFGTVFSLTLPPSNTLPAITGVVSAADFQAGIVPNSFVTILGTNLAARTDTWGSAIVGGSLPTSLDGVKVSVGGQAAFVSYISPTQINAVAPNVGTGPLAVTVTNSVGTSAAVTAVSQTVQPAFFQWGSYAVATRPDFSLAAKNGAVSGQATVPAKPGDVIILWGTGFGPTSPPAPSGVEVPFTPTFNTANPVTVTVGGTPAIVYGAALTPGYAGLFQVAIQIPATLANGDYSVVASISGAQSPASTLITVQQ